jgi:hypothetical protein
MTEQPEQHDLAESADGPDAPDHAPLRTGNERVDAVLESLEGLDHTSVEDHVPVFERAHEELRRALDAPADEVAGSSDTEGG